MYKGQEVTAAEAPELYEMVDRLRQKAELPMPKVYVVPNAQPNAFATGRNPSHAAVAVTNGIVTALSKRELEGVIAHELAHIKHRDILTSTIAATVASAITLLARFALFVPMGNRDNNGGGGLQALAMLILAPIAAMLIQMSISRLGASTRPTRAARPSRATRRGSRRRSAGSSGRRAAARRGVAEHGPYVHRQPVRRRDGRRPRPLRYAPADARAHGPPPRDGRNGDLLLQRGALTDRLAARYRAGGIPIAVCRNSWRSRGTMTRSGVWASR